jgi:hypothetical protein
MKVKKTTGEGDEVSVHVWWVGGVVDGVDGGAPKAPLWSLGAVEHICTDGTALKHDARLRFSLGSSMLFPQPRRELGRVVLVAVLLLMLLLPPPPPFSPPPPSSPMFGSPCALS